MTILEGDNWLFLLSRWGGIFHVFLPWVVWEGTTSKKLFSKHLPMLAEGQHFCLLMKVVGVGHS